MIGLTRKQRELFDFLADYVAETNGLAPSTAEMQTAMDLRSKSGVVRLLNGLEERGYIRRIRNRARALEIVERPQSTVTLNTEILTLTDRYAAEHRISRDTAANELLRIALGAAA